MKRKRFKYKGLIPGGVGTFTYILEIMNTHGGKRKRAGRRTISLEEKRCRLSTTIKPDILKFIQDEAKETYGMSPGTFIDCLVEAYQKAKAEGGIELV